MPLGRKECPDCSAGLFGHERFCPFCGNCFKGFTILSRTKYVRMLERYLPERSLERLLASDTGIISERRYASVMFADVSGFTSMSEDMPAEQVAETMNGVFEGMVAVVHRYDGTVDKFIGDAVMAVFGAPVGHDNDPERAVCAALEMMSFVREHSDRIGRRLSLAIGINAGPLVAGSIGGHGRLNYSVLGDTVNVAQRLEAAAGAGRILVTREVWQRAKDVVRFKTLAPIKVKGKRNPIDVWEARERRPRGETEVREGRLIGRRAEFDQLRKLVIPRGAQLVALSGEAGVGRTALVERLQQAVRSGMQATYAACPSYGAQTDAGLLAETVGQLLRVRISQGVGALKDGKNKLVELGLSEQEASLLLASASREKPDTASLDYQATLRATCAAFLRVLAACAARQPLLVVFEDLHWANPTVQAQLSTLLELGVPAGVTMVWTARSEGATLWAGRPEVAHLKLEPLGAENTRALVTDRLRLAVLDERIAARIHATTHGNPRMVDELVHAFIDQGLIFRSRNRWLVSPKVAEADSPPGLDALIAARIDELDADTRRFLKAAAVVGSPFDAELVRRVAGLQLDVEWVLSNLLDRRIVVPDEERGSLLRFAHEGWQRVASEMMVSRERRLLHVRLGGYLQETTDLKNPRSLQRVAFHLAEGADPDKGAALLLKAARRLVEVHQVDNAVDLLEKLITIAAPRGYAGYELSRCETELDEALYRLGMLLQRKGLFAEAEDKLQWAYGRARHFFNGDLRVWSLLGLAELNLSRGRADEARKFLELAAVDSEGMRDAALLAVSLLERARLFNREGKPDSALEACEKGLEAEQRADPELRATLPQPLSRALILIEKGHALHQLGRTPEANSAFFDAHKLAAQLNDLSARGHAVAAMAKMAMANSDFGRAAELSAEGLRCFRAVGDRVAEGRCMHNIALMETARGNLPRATEALQQAERIFTEIAHREGLALLDQLRQKLTARRTAQGLRG